MIPATETVHVFDPATGEQRSYTHWMYTNFTISHDGDKFGAQVTCRRCRIVPEQTAPEFLTDGVADAIGKQATISMTVTDVTKPGDNYPAEIAQMVGPIQQALLPAIASLMNHRGTR